MIAVKWRKTLKKKLNPIPYMLCQWKTNHRLEIRLSVCWKSLNQILIILREVRKAFEVKRRPNDLLESAKMKPETSWLTSIKKKLIWKILLLYSVLTLYTQCIKKISTAKKQIFSFLKDLYKMLSRLVGPKKIDIIRFSNSYWTCVPSFIDLWLKIMKL